MKPYLINEVVFGTNKVRSHNNQKLLVYKVIILLRPWTYNKELRMRLGCKYILQRKELSVINGKLQYWLLSFGIVITVIKHLLTALL